MNPLEFSVVIPALNEAESIPQLVSELSQVMGETGKSWEVIFVDDGSQDGTADLLRALASTGGVVRVIIFKRRFGQSAALEAGFLAARGRFLLPMDADLQHDPRDFFPMLRQLEAEEADMVVGWRKDRKDGKLRSAISATASRIISEVTGVPLHDHGCNLKVIRREPWHGQRIPPGWHRFLGVIACRRGMVVRERVINHRPRLHGESHYDFMRIPVVARDAARVTRLTPEACRNLQGVSYEIAEMLPPDPVAESI